MHPSAVVRPVSQPTTPRTVYVTVSCPGCNRLVEWLGVDSREAPPVAVAWWRLEFGQHDGSGSGGAGARPVGVSQLTPAELDEVLRIMDEHIAKRADGAADDRL